MDFTYTLHIFSFNYDTVNSHIKIRIYFYHFPILGKMYFILCLFCPSQVNMILFCNKTLIFLLYLIIKIYWLLFSVICFLIYYCCVWHHFFQVISETFSQNCVSVLIYPWLLHPFSNTYWLILTPLLLNCHLINMSYVITHWKTVTLTCF